MFLCIFADAIRMERAEAKRPLLAIVHGADDAIRMERAEAKAVYQFPGVLPCQDAIRMERAEAKVKQFVTSFRVAMLQSAWNVLT